MYRYALRPRWLLSHAFALFVVLLFVNLGLWQLRRHDERADRNATVAARAEIAPVAVGDLVGAGSPDDLRFRRVTASGSYEDLVVFVDNRSLGGLPGVWVLQPIRLDGGDAVVVNRGFLGYVSGELDVPAAPIGPVELLGSLVPWDDRDCGTRRDDAGELVGMACLHRDAVETALGAPVEDVVVQRIASEPAEPPSLAAVPRPELGSGPHRGYAGQWFIFATIVGVVYVLILRKVARERAREPDATT